MRGTLCSVFPGVTSRGSLWGDKGVSPGNGSGAREMLEHLNTVPSFSPIFDRLEPKGGQAVRVSIVTQFAPLEGPSLDIFKQGGIGGSSGREGYSSVSVIGLMSTV